MEDLENKTNEELIAHIEQLNGTIDEHEQLISELEEEAVDYQVESEQHEEIDKEEVAQSAFFAGHKASEDGEVVMRSWLNYKIEARI